MTGRSENRTICSSVIIFESTFEQNFFVIYASQTTLGNKLHSEVLCTCTLECNLDHNIHSDILFVNYPPLSNAKYTKILLEEHQLDSLFVCLGISRKRDRSSSLIYSSGGKVGRTKTLTCVGKCFINVCSNRFLTLTFHPKKGLAMSIIISSSGKNLL